MLTVGQTKHFCQVRWLLLANNGTNGSASRRARPRVGSEVTPIDLYCLRGSCRRRSTLGAGIGGIARVAERVLGRKLLTAIDRTFVSQKS